MESFIGPQHARYAAWFERRRGPRDPQDEAALLAIADAYDAALQTGTLTSEQLQRVVDGASSRKALLWNNATDLLMSLSGRWPAAADAIVAMSRSPQAHVRFAAICSLGKNTPLSITDAVLRAGLTDRSSSVRWKAADRSNVLERVTVIPDITAALAVEQNAKARQSIELDLRMLRDGYWIRPEAPGSLWITVRSRSGGIAGRSISETEMESEGLERILDRLHCWPAGKESGRG